jgi:hypothetical protein
LLKTDFSLPTAISEKDWWARKSHLLIGGKTQVAKNRPLPTCV